MFVVPQQAPPESVMKTTKQRQKERRDHRFRVQFHSEKRCRFIKALPCEVTGIESGPDGDVVNAHTKGGGVGRRGCYTSIVPLYWRVHHDFDDGMTEKQFHQHYARSKQSVRDRAPYYAKLWEDR